MKELCICTSFIRRTPLLVAVAAGSALALAPASMGAGQRGPSTSTSKYAPGRAPAQKTPGQIVKGNGGIAGGPANDDCVNAIVIFDGVTAYTDIGASTDGPAEAGCGFCCGDAQINQDIWFNYFASQTGMVTVSLCGSGYDTKVALYDGCACPPGGAPLACNDDSCGLQSNISAAVTAGNCYKLRVGAYAGNSGDGTINISYGGGGNPACGANATHDCFSTGGPGCTDEVCCNLICGMDSFCCATAWDSICVSEANSNCAGGVSPCDDPNNHPCDQTGGPGCSDHDCCTTVCAVDSFCCQVAWDSICVSEAAVFCGPPCPTDCPAGSIQENEPCGSDTNGGCNSTPPVYGSIACGQTVCANQWASGGTRDTDWYQFTIAQDQTTVNWSVFAAFPSVAFILNNDCGNIVLIAIGTGNCPVRAEASGCSALAAGTYVAFAAPASFDGLPCGGKNNAYYGTLTCTAPCLSDINHDGVTNTSDLLYVINHWGPCP